MFYVSLNFEKLKKILKMFVKNPRIINSFYSLTQLVVKNNNLTRNL